MKIILSFFITCMSVNSMATTYYVSNTGDDSKSGLSGSPWRTLDKVNSVTFTAGDQILFERGGTFYGSFTIKQSGASGNPITFGAYGSGSNPVITGFTDVTTWTQAGSNLWESTNAISTLSNCNMVSINNVNTEMGRFPKSSAANGGYLTYQSHSGQTSITSSDLTGTPNWTGAEVVIRSGAFHIKRSAVTSQTGSTINFNSIGETPTDKNGFFFQNDDRCLTQQNDWRYNSTTKKIKVYSSTMPSGVKVASVENLITIDGNYLSISNITFTGANGCGIWKNPSTGYKSNVSITNCTFSYTGIAAIYVYINYLTVEGNTITESNNSAIAISSGTDNVIRNNTISNIGVLKGMKYLVSPYNANTTIDAANPTRLTIEYNSIRNIGFNGISFWASNTALIKNNFIDRYCTILDDGGAIYTYSVTGTVCQNVKITGNICINGIGAVEGSSFTHVASGIYLDARSANIELTYNTIANAREYGMFVASNGNVQARYNTIYNSSQIQYYSVWFGGDIPSPTTSDIVKNNLFISKQKNSSTDDSYQKCLAFYFTGADPTVQILASTALDSNCYARPVGDDKVLRASIPVSGCKTLSEWRTFYKQDIHSYGSPQTIPDTSKLRFEYNNTKTAQVIPLSKPMIDFRGTKYVGSVTLQPYSSIVLMEDNNPTEITSLAEQILNLRSGWNIISFNVIPSSTDFNTIFKPLIQSGVLVKIQDEKGHFMVNTVDGWYSNLDPLDTRKGYNIKVNADAQLVIKGQQVSAGIDIPLTAGFNIIGYPLLKSREALSNFQNLINENSLTKVQDETGKFIIKNGSNWYSGIDSLQAGKGYYVNVSQNTSINFGSFTTNKAVVANEMAQSSVYFQKSFSGNPYSSMNFILRNLSKSNLKLSSGDEIGIFDGNSCVGTVIYDGLNVVGISAGMSDQASQISGFTQGDTIRFQVWKPTEQVLIKNITAIYLNNSSFVFTSKGTAIVELQAQMATSIPVLAEGLELKNYPNPFVDNTNFEFKLGKKTNISLEIIDLQGRKVIEITNKEYEPGTYNLIWNGENQNGQNVSPGIYMYRYRAGSFISSKKIIYGSF